MIQWIQFDLLFLCVQLLQSCLTVCDPMDCDPPSFSVHEISQARILEWAAIFFYRESSWPRNQTLISCVSCTDRSLPLCGTSAFSKSSLYIWKFLVHVLLKPSLKNFEHNLFSMQNECNCMVVWAFFGTALLWDWNENWPFPVLWPLLSFPNLLTYWMQHFNSIIL